MGRADHTAVLCAGKVYIGGGSEYKFGSSSGTGSHRIDIYTPSNNTWSRSPIYTSYHHFAMTTLNNQLITAGGNIGDEVTNKIFSLDGDHLTEYARMITPRYCVTAAGHQGTLIITGGIGEKYRILATTELFNSTTGQWYTTSDLPLPHYELCSVIVDNNLYLFGGNNENCNISSAVFTAPLDTLSIHKLQWSSQDAPMYHSAPVSIHGRHLLTVGGVKKTGSGYVRTSDIHKFNKISHSWEIIGQIPSARRAPAAVNVTDNNIIVLGGVDIEGELTNTVWIGSCQPQ